MANELEEGWLLQSDTGLALLNHLSKEASKRASQFKFGNPSHATPHTSENVSARLDISLHQPSCVMGILSRARIESEDNSGSFWNQLKVKHYWTVRLHGDSATGKTAISQALCRLRSITNSQADTPGLVIRETLVPIKLLKESSIRWVRLEIEDIGHQQETKYNYLKFDSQRSRPFHVHIVVFSMTDAASLESAKQSIAWLNQQCGVGLTSILAVATKVDEFQNYQITDLELQEFVSLTNVSLCLVNNHAQFGEDHSVYVIVEELARLILPSSQ